MMRRRRALIVACSALVVPGLAEAQQRRLALVIGNSAYRSEPLKNPVNDARAVAASLRTLGFRVIHQENTSFRDLISALQEFSIQARSHDVRVFYYAGHGVQMRGRNFLIPVDAELQSEEDVQRKSVEVADLLERLGELRGGMNVLVLDACRNNPFINRPGVDGDGRRFRTRSPIKSGLAKVDAPNGTLIAYSTAPGAVSMDTRDEPNSVYTKHFLAALPEPGQTIENLFKRVRIAVARETQQLQVPWESSSLMGEFCFAVDGAGRCGQ
jgi:uncharacterized caspase-like protein